MSRNLRVEQPEGGAPDHGSRIPYFPGCGLKDQARRFEATALAAMRRLGWELAELPEWNCCGTVYSLATDDLMRHLGPVRNLIRVQQLGKSRLVTLCSMCYSTLKRSASFVTQDSDRLERVNAFLDQEPDYQGGVAVVHLLEVLRDEVGFDTLRASLQRPLSGLAVAPYYGCTLLRPRGMGLDDPDRPQVFEDLLSALGADVVDYPQKVECCGAYLTVGSPEVAGRRAAAILGAAARAGAGVVATSCPLCQFNLESRAAQFAREFAGPRAPSVYFTQLLAWALGEEAELPSGLQPAAAGEAGGGG
ncbi:MAG: CoB--CoM heterodisulfide reductase iron-sulfur subunit B family protein [Candidatus Bipolaricaulaceae bacterium]